MTDNFYRAFEDRYRGSRDLIKHRLVAYLPFVEPLLAHYPEARALDLGCGRGEWLELLASAGFMGRGVDLDEGMLSASRELGLDVQKSDVLDALKAVDDSSLTVVSAFHLVEHIEFDRLRELVAEALRVLVPGGLLIMETPNPENIVVAGCNFYLDPTHNRPIPPTLLSFVAEHAGFSRVKVVRLQESTMLRDPGYPIDLLGVLDGVSPDYAVVAQKSGNDEIFGCNTEAFQKEYGLSLHTVATRYTQQAETKAQQLESRATTVEAEARAAKNDAHIVAAEAEIRALQSESLRLSAELRAQQAETKAQQLESRAATVEAEARAAIDEAHRSAAGAELRALQSESLRLGTELRAQQAEGKTQQAEAHAAKLQTELNAVHAANHHHWQLAEARHQEIERLVNSTSWRITAVMRWVALVPQRRVNTMTYRLIKLPKTVRLMTKEKIKLTLEHAKLYIARRPKLKKALIGSPRLRFMAKWAIGHYPRLKPIVKNLMELESPRLNPRSFDSLAAIRIMGAMSESHTNTTNPDPVIFLQVPHEQ